MYYLVPEKPLRLVYGTFYLAIDVTFYEFIKIDWIKEKVSKKFRLSYISCLRNLSFLGNSFDWGSQFATSSLACEMGPLGHYPYHGQTFSRKSRLGHRAPSSCGSRVITGGFF